MLDRKYADFAWEQAEALLAIDSPTGFTASAAAWVKEAFENLGFSAELTTKGGVLVDLGGENAEDALMLAAHTDTLGGMVAEIKGSGHLRITALGGMSANNGEATDALLKAHCSFATPPSTSTGTILQPSAPLIPWKYCWTRM